MIKNFDGFESIDNEFWKLSKFKLVFNKISFKYWNALLEIPNFTFHDNNCDNSIEVSSILTVSVINSSIWFSI